MTREKEKSIPQAYGIPIWAVSSLIPCEGHQNNDIHLLPTVTLSLGRQNSGSLASFHDLQNTSLISRMTHKRLYGCNMPDILTFMFIHVHLHTYKQKILEAKLTTFQNFE